MARLAFFLLASLIVASPCAGQTTNTTVAPAATASPAAPANGAGGGSNLTSESQVLIYESVRDATGRLVDELTESVAKSQPAVFVVNLPFAAEDVANLRMIKQEIADALARLQQSFADNRPLPEVADAWTLTRNQVDALITDELKAEAAEAQSGKQPVAPQPTNPPVPSSPAPLVLPHIDINQLIANANTYHLLAAQTTGLPGGVLGEGATDASAVGMITDSITGLLTLAQTTLHNTYTTTEGSAAFAQTDAIQILESQLRRFKSSGRTYTVYDYSQPVIPSANPLSDSDFLTQLKKLSDADLAAAKAYNALPAVPKPLTLEEQGALQQLDKDFDDLRNQLLTPAWARLKNRNAKLPSAPDSVWNLQPSEIDARRQYYKDYLNNRTAAATDQKNLITAIWAFIQVVYGSAAPQYVLPTAAFVPTQNQNPPATAQTTIPLSNNASLTLQLTIGAPAPAAPASPATPSAAANTPGLSAIASPSFMNLAAKFDYMDECLRPVYGASSYYLNSRITVGNATASTVNRFLLENYIALSNRAVVHLDAVALSTRELAFSDEKEAFYNYIYYPSRVRDGAENTNRRNNDILNPEHWINFHDTQAR